MQTLSLPVTNGKGVQFRAHLIASYAFYIIQICNNFSNFKHHPALAFGSLFTVMAEQEMAIGSA
jgi:hypothetical protein